MRNHEQDLKALQMLESPESYPSLTNSPPEWAALGTWHAEAVEKFDGLLPASTPGIARG
jgi:hypothetical protein